MSTETRIIQSATDTAANWTSNNPTLLAGEVAIESDTKSIKIGDGATAWTSLGYYNGGLAKIQNIYQNAIVDPSCEIALNASTVNISTSYQYGVVTIVKMKCGGTVGAGTIAQGTAIGKNLTSAKAAGTTLTGSGAVYAKVFIEAKEAIKFKNLTASFSLQVKHDVGSNVNYYIYIKIRLFFQFF